MSHNSDIIRVKHMHDTAKEALNFIKGNDKESLKCNRMLSLALIKDLEILGEAASKISKEFREQNQQIPWRLIIATRNRLTHGYFDTDLDILWDTVNRDLPRLLKELEKLNT